MSSLKPSLQVVVPAIALVLVTIVLLGLRVILLSFQKPPDPPPEGMVWIPGGSTEMGSTEFPESQPVHTVTVRGFWMDETEVTNDQFAEFVKAKNYVTLAERQPEAKYAASPFFAGKKLAPFSFVFSPPGPETPVRDYSSWWAPVVGADWRHPQGPGSNIEGKGKHPAVQISWEDAAAYAAWAGKRLPTEAEWEFAARGGLDRKKYVWGDELKPGGQAMANYWQGRFPKENTMEDGFRGTAPVRSFPPNGFGLYDMSGNAWEWCSDWYRADYFAGSPRSNPQGPDSSLDPQEPGVKKRVQKGGSFLCADVYCARYVAGARHSGDIEATADHIGFRCVRDPR